MTTPAASTVFFWKRHDTAPPIQCTLTDPNNNAIDLTGSTVKFIMVAADSNGNPVTGTPKISRGATIVTPATNGVVQFSPAGTDTDTAGQYLAEWEVTYPSTNKETFPGNGYVNVTIVADLDNA